MLRQPLLDDAPREVSTSQRLAPRRWQHALLTRLGVESAAESKIVLALALQAFLANSVFVFGRNVGPVIFMHECGPEALTSAIVVSGLAVIFVSPMYASASAGKLASHINLWLSLVAAGVLLALALPLVIVRAVPYLRHPPGWLLWLSDVSESTRKPAAYLIYQMQDLLTLLLMMQSASLSQATLSLYTAKRLLGLVQLGCSTGAVVTGLTAGALARTVGPAAMILVQVVLILLALVPARTIRQAEERMVRASEKRGKPQAADGAKRAAPSAAGASSSSKAEGAEWCASLALLLPHAIPNRTPNSRPTPDREPVPAPAPAPPEPAAGRARACPRYASSLILSMALWVFSIIFCKTIVEYQYNVLLADAVSQTNMIALTGYLYAAAGLLSSLLNAFGGWLLRHAGMGVVLMMSPGAELAAAVGMLLAPGVPAAFIGRTLDLTMRWSLNNTAKSLLWIATPRAQQEQASAGAPHARAQIPADLRRSPQISARSSPRTPRARRARAARPAHHRRRRTVPVVPRSHRRARAAAAAATRRSRGSHLHLTCISVVSRLYLGCHQAKPWIEGTVKKATASVAAVAIGTALWLTDQTFSSLAVMSSVVAFAACVACGHMHRLYSSSMWQQIQKRELQLAGAFELSAETMWGTEGCGLGWPHSFANCTRIACE